MKRISTWAVLLLSFCGLADSWYLTQSEVNGTPLLCNINNLTGCNIVAQSPYSHLFGIPLAEYGLMFYGILFIVAALELFFFHYKARRTIQLIAAFGFLASLYFVFLQVVVINALCIYCMASAAVTIFIFIASLFLEEISVGARSAMTVSSAPPRPPHFSMPPSA